jgi:predicted branched-subunit amino acid permease
LIGGMGFVLTGLFLFVVYSSIKEKELSTLRE